MMKGVNDDVNISLAWRWAARCKYFAYGEVSSTRIDFADLKSGVC